MSNLVTGSPFLVPLGDLRRENARLTQENASLKDALAAAYEKIASLEKTSAESKKP